MYALFSLILRKRRHRKHAAKEERSNVPHCTGEKVSIEGKNTKITGKLTLKKKEKATVSCRHNQAVFGCTVAGDADDSEDKHTDVHCVQRTKNKRVLLWCSLARIYLSRGNILELY